MFNLDELSQQIAAYRDGRVSLGEFEEWFEENSAGAYEDPSLRESCLAVDAAFSGYHFDHIGEAAMKQELEAAIQPFYLHQENTGANSSDAPLHFAVSASNNNIGFNGIRYTAA